MKSKQVMKVDMFGRKFIVLQNFGSDFEFRVFEVFPDFRNDYHVGSFKSFQEAWTFIELELWN